MTITAASTVQDVHDVGMEELRANLDAYLRRVADGESLRLTEGGRPIARSGG